MLSALLAYASAIRKCFPAIITSRFDSSTINPVKPPLSKLTIASFPV